MGLQCGGSDGYSGISANPALGAAVDRLVRHGGTAILSETPEIYGGEHLLTRRAVSPEVAHKLLARLRWWERYCERNDAQMDNNPSGRQQGWWADHHPGEVAGGHCQERHHQPGGRAGVRRAGDAARPRVHGHARAYDPVSATGQVAGGANLICFTTGRGSAYGCAPSPSLKLSTNTALWQRQAEDIDINCGDIVDGSASIDDLGERIFQLMLETASGRKSKSELHGYGQSEFVPWQLGAVM